MGNLFQEDFDTEAELRGAADERARAYEELAGLIPGSDIARSRYNAATGRGTDRTAIYDSGLAAGASEWAGDHDFGESGREIDALRRLEALSRGGLTAEDRAMLDANARAEGAMARGDREASLADLEARGMGSSGSSLAASLGAGEAATGRAADANAAALAAAQARAYDALGAYTSLGSHIRDRELGATTSRMSALDAWNASERDRAERLGASNTERRREDASRYEDALQREWENRYATTTAATSTSERDSERTADQQNTEEERDSEREGQIISGASSIGGGMLGLAR